MDVNEITMNQIEFIVNETCKEVINCTTDSGEKKPEPPLMQELLYDFSEQRVKVSGKIGHKSSRTKRLGDNYEMTLTTILLLKSSRKIPICLPTH